MADGKIVREDLIGSPVEEDLKMWRHSGLGKRIVTGDAETFEKLSLSQMQVDAVRTLLEQADGG